MTQDKFKETNSDDLIKVTQISYNTTPLPKLYNKFLRDERNSKIHDFVAFMHGDVSFNLDNFIEHLKDIGDKYGLIGLCGTSTLNVSQSPLNWWTGSNPTPYAKWGCVTHGELGNQTSWFSEHSPTVMDAEVACIDGLCIIFAKDALNSTLEFDENLGDFDFYDTDISMQAIAKYKIKIGVMVQKDLCHYSIGKSILTPAFLSIEEKFRAKWNLPIPSGSALEKYIASKQQS